MITMKLHISAEDTFLLGLTHIFSLQLSWKSYWEFLNNLGQAQNHKWKGMQITNLRTTPNSTVFNQFIT